MKNYTMVIPTYWGRAGDAVTTSEEILFDHPTPLDQDGTLSRLLESLEVLKGADGKVVIIAAANNLDVAREMEDKVRNIVAPFREEHDIEFIFLSTLMKISETLAREGISAEARSFLNLNNYAAIRNICALAGILNGSENTIFIDDDEVFTDPYYLAKIEQVMGSRVNGETVKALAGYYLQPETPMLDENKVPAWRAPFWNNAAAMNRAFEKYILSGPRVKSTLFVFGGNMTLSLETLCETPFDPKITRGEDIDFLLNLRVHGTTFFLDNTLSIKHFPPGSSRPDWKKVREDIFRYLYDHKKVMDHDEIDLSELQPYPGMFLGPDLHERIVKTNELLGAEYDKAGDTEGAAACRENISIARDDPFKDFDTRRWLAGQTARWQELTKALLGLGIPVSGA